MMPQSAATVSLIPWLLVRLLRAFVFAAIFDLDLFLTFSVL